ncbi:hypothetical protein RB25_09635 [Herbaspirillum rubrisubalbicans]|uniref:TIR domain-containing protein n=1 Tax=Herbaspirillum rubrisubalbicans TaxID=80842 RepID=UPI000DC33E6D|nr:TIR domain-containing protein [Herbaspirillum rubrisubalbicans]RAN48597.1 hypothetical protein RB25_09635 [Herbaspirillum rubrisubalbicans]
MTKAFYSFHFDRDVSRVGQVRNMGFISGDQLINDNSWEQVKRGGDTEISNWIRRQMGACDVVIVLVGKETATRPWVDYEIRHAWNSGKPVFGIAIHGLKNLSGLVDSPGSNPFLNIKMEGSGVLADHVPLYNPAGADSKQVYATIEANLTQWIAAAPKRKI